MSQVSLSFDDAVGVVRADPIGRAIQIHESSAGLEIHIMNNKVGVNAANLASEVVDVFFHTVGSGCEMGNELLRNIGSAVGYGNSKWKFFHNPVLPHAA